MAPHNIPHHWKQIVEQLDDLQLDIEEDSDVEDNMSSLDFSEEDEVIAYVLHDQDEQSSVNSELSLSPEGEEEEEENDVEFYPLSEDEERNTTPIEYSVPNARRRLFYNSSSDEEDDDGADY